MNKSIKTQPLVSVVTPSYNQGEFLEETIQSVLSQDYERLEYIVIDGGSTDQSVEIIQKYQNQIAYWVSEPDQGQTDAINKGFSQSKGEILAWINSDDLYYPGTIRSVVDYLNQNPEIEMVYGDTDIINHEGKVVGKFNAQQTNYNRLMRGGVYIPQPAAFWRRSLWERTGPLDPSYYFAMDYDLWIRFSQKTKLVYVPKLWSAFRIHQEGKTTVSDDRCWPEMKEIHRSHGGGVFSFFMGKYILRQLLSPIWKKFKKWQLDN